MDVEQRVAQLYTRKSLARAILDGLAASGKDPTHLTLADLAPFDEFHIGGRQATIDFATRLDPPQQGRLLDIGCGIGGASRYFAVERGCHVTGIDLTEEYVEVATVLAERTGLVDRLSYRRASATVLPFEAETFDGAYLLHVGMNIQDKATLCAAVRRVLRPGGVFGIYDVMRERDGELTFPVPWASDRSMSFVDRAATYGAHLERAGFVVQSERSRREFAIDSLRELGARTSPTVPGPLGPTLFMGPDGAQKVANMLAALESGLISPTEIIAHAS